MPVHNSNCCNIEDISVLCYRVTFIFIIVGLCCYQVACFNSFNSAGDKTDGFLSNLGYNNLQYESGMHLQHDGNIDNDRILHPRRKRQSQDDKSDQSDSVKTNVKKNVKREAANKTSQPSTNGGKSPKKPISNLSDKTNTNEGQTMSNEILVPKNHEITTATNRETFHSEPGSIDACPYSVCICHSLLSKLSNELLKTYDCTGLELKNIISEEIPLWSEVVKLTSNRIDIELLGDLKPFVYLKELYLEVNHIYSLQNWSPLSKSLSYFSIDRNEIDYLANGTLLGVSNLIHLSASGNKIEVIHNNALAGLYKLEVLILTDNRISEIDSRWFRNLDSLKELQLGSNNVHTLEDSHFHNLEQLEILDLSANHLHSIHNKAFVGLKKLKFLYLHHNNINSFPTVALQVFSNCDIIDISYNYIDTINPYDVVNINVTHFKLNYLQSLILVDSHSFIDLPFLKKLEIARNDRLTYIDRSAFINIPSLQVLLLHGNALSTLEKEVPLSMSSSSLKEIDLSDNPLYCDCVIMWMTDKLFLHNSNITIINANNTICDQPSDDLKGIPVTDLKSRASLVKAANTVGCAPRIIISLFKAKYTVSLGDSLTISCKATGVPLPNVLWQLPENHKRKLDKLAKKKSSNIRHSNLLVDRLAIDFAEKEDQGKYSCFAKNTVGKASASSYLSIKMSSAYLIISKSTATSITLTWARTHRSRDYELVYHPDILSTNFTYQSVKIEPYMKEYSLSGLRPSTKYHICISVPYLGKHIPINCTDVMTRDVHFIEQALHSSKNIVLSGAISTLLCVVIFICIVGYFSRRYNKKKEREQKLYTDSLSQLYPGSLDSISDTTPITYENKIAEMFDLDDNGEIICTADQTTSLTQ